MCIKKLSLFSNILIMSVEKGDRLEYLVFSSEIKIKIKFHHQETEMYFKNVLTFVDNSFH